MPVTVQERAGGRSPPSFRGYYRVGLTKQKGEKNDFTRSEIQGYWREGYCRIRSESASREICNKRQGKEKNNRI